MKAPRTSKGCKRDVKPHNGNIDLKGIEALIDEANEGASVGDDRLPVILAKLFDMLDSLGWAGVKLREDRVHLHEHMIRIREFCEAVSHGTRASRSVELRHFVQQASRPLQPAAPTDRP